jgi:hypothetical protein
LADYLGGLLREQLAEINPIDPAISS